MPQMAPISWLILFFFFILFFFLFNVLNFYCFFNKTNKTFNLKNNNSNSFLIWKW